MKLTKKTVELRFLEADNGMVLTNGETFSSVNGKVSLGVNDTPENWHEITETEYEEIQKAIDEHYDFSEMTESGV